MFVQDSMHTQLPKLSCLVKVLKPVGELEAVFLGVYYSKKAVRLE